MFGDIAREMLDMKEKKAQEEKMMQEKTRGFPSISFHKTDAYMPLYFPDEETRAEFFNALPSTMSTGNGIMIAPKAKLQTHFREDRDWARIILTSQGVEAIYLD